MIFVWNKFIIIKKKGVKFIFSSKPPVLNKEDERLLRKYYHKDICRLENLLSKINLGKYYDLFRWIDSTYTELVYELLPKSTNFLGINFVYESHVLERHKLKYNFDEIYLKALSRDPSRGNIFLSQFVGKLKKR